MSTLFSSFKLREIEFRNRIFVSPMCQYSCQDGMPGDWHLVHLGARAVGGAALVVAEATAVSPEGRISPWDSGIWTEGHAQRFGRITSFIREQGSVPGIQLAHAGRKASVDVPWRGGHPLPEDRNGWQPVAPSPIPFGRSSPVPREMTGEDIAAVVSQFSAAAERSLAAGFDVLEIHMAHGYLFHEFLSPLSNHRKDRWGGALENREAFPLETAAAVRRVWPKRLPLFVRISSTDWVEGGWDLTQSIHFCRRLKEIGVDLIDCSSGGTAHDAVIPAGPGFQTPFSAAVRREAGIATGAVGLITEPVQAEQILITGQADAVMMGRELLRNPYWPMQAARALGADHPWPDQYKRAKPA